MPPNPRDLKYGTMPLPDPPHVPTDVDTFMGHGVNDFTSRTLYAVFNDLKTFGDLAAPESLLELLFETPLLEDEDADRVVRHAALMNAERAHGGSSSRVVVKSKLILETPYEVM